MRGSKAAPSPDESNRRWRILGLLSLAEVLGMSVWFSASAVSPHLRELWGLSAGQAGWLTTAVQVGFVAGTAVAAALNIADLVPARWYFATTRAASTGATYPVWTEDVLAFGAIAAGGLGCVWGGWQAGRVGRERLVNLAMAASGVCSLLIGWFFGADPWLLAGIAWAWVCERP